MSVNLAQIKCRGLRKADGDHNRILPITFNGLAGWSTGQLADLGDPPMGWQFTETKVRDAGPYMSKRQDEKEVSPTVVWKSDRLWKETFIALMASADETVAQTVELRFVVHFLRKYKNVLFFGSEYYGQSSIRVESDGETVGAFMPIGIYWEQYGHKPIIGKALIETVRKETNCNEATV